MIPVNVPLYYGYGKFRCPEIHRGYRITKHFVLFQNPRRNQKWCIATGAGQTIHFGFKRPFLAIRLAEELEQTGVDWSVFIGSSRQYGEYKELITSIRDFYRTLADS